VLSQSSPALAAFGSDSTTFVPRVLMGALNWSNQIVGPQLASSGGLGLLLDFSTKKSLLASLIGRIKVVEPELVNSSGPRLLVDPEFPPASPLSTILGFNKSLFASLICQNEVVRPGSSQPQRFCLPAYPICAQHYLNVLIGVLVLGEPACSNRLHLFNKS